MSVCLECQNEVPSATHEFVDEDGTVEEELYACPECGHTWSEYP